MYTLKLIATVIYDYTNLTVFLAVFVFLLTFKLLGKPNRLPPGPRPWPLIGNLLTMNQGSIHHQFTEWAQQYGDVFTVYYGPKPVVVINGYDTIHDVLINRGHAFSDRPNFNNSRGILFAPYGSFWKEQRKFTMSGLRDFGFGKRSLEGKIMEEAEALGREIIKTDGQPFNIFYMLRKAVTNVICSIVFEARHDYEDSAFQALLQHIDVFFRASRPVLIFSRTALRHVPVLGQSLKMHYESVQRALQFVKTKVEEHQRDFDPDDIRDFVDTYIKEMKTVQNENFTETHLVYIINDLISAGTDTTTRSLYWILLYMILYPDVQKQAYREIYGIFGDIAPPTTAKRPDVPFTDAVISEVQRINCVGPLTVPHCTSEDTSLRGYTIPKGTRVEVNLWSVLKDPGLWEEPDQFKPERFLDNEGQYMKKDAFIPFSIGRRSCLGMQLARMELFMFTTYLLQHFTFSLPEGAPPPSTVGKLGLTLEPEPYKLCATPK